MWMDLKYPPSPTGAQYNYHVQIHEAAFYPPLTYTKIYFKGFPNWSLSLHTPQALTVYAILEQVYYYLQQCDGPQDAQSARVAYGAQSSQFKTHGAGGRRVDALNGRTIVQGFQAAGGHNEWIIHLAHVLRQ
ncbi:hypothetical protein NLJ89_g12320 [Agrocybe chaxingu]|uniref:DUF6699 domain-containing protein n=1 Tax=Agrocybe chaxingu TaxID=84603 RepID=A0A9W8JQQ4_9AGAR|nr:hypothetical protein NLJ89_g12320 [Agrocybe chaxingu]